jgi:serine phosphatase RsbU (regulator of sigma subunit)
VLGGEVEPDRTAAWLVAAGAMAAIVAMGALAITTSRHQRRLGRANDLLTLSETRTRAVQEVAGRLARALTAHEIVGALVDHLPAAVGASSAVIVARNDSGAVEVLGLAEPSEEATTTVLPGADDPGSHVHTVLDDGQSVWLRSPLDWRGDEAAAALAGDGVALALLPLAGDDVTGLLAVAYPKVRIFGEDEQRLLHTISILAARALARGQRYDAEHRAAVAFQRAALPDDLPSVPGLSIAARYRPASRQSTVGGDWYDVLVLDERRVVLVVGDVVGHGMVAAAAMGRLRTAFQAIARLSADPGTMVVALSNQVDSIPDSFCTTVVCAVVDLATGELTWCRAGHTPPLLLRADGPELLDEPCLPPLGVALDPAPVVQTRWLRPGDRVVLYTDGVVERRDESIDDGFRRLSVAADALGDLDPEEFTDALVEAMVPAYQADDLAVLVVRYDEQPEVELAARSPEEPVRLV